MPSKKGVRRSSLCIGDVEACLSVLMHLGSHQERGGSSIAFDFDNVDPREKHFEYLVKRGYVERIAEQVIKEDSTGRSFKAVDCCLTKRGNSLYKSSRDAYNFYLRVGSDSFS